MLFTHDSNILTIIDYVLEKANDDENHIDLPVDATDFQEADFDDNSEEITAMPKNKNVVV